MNDWVAVTNPRASQNRRSPKVVARLAQRLGQDLAQPDGFDDLAKQVSQWRAKGVRRIAIHGGDGTVHRVVTAVAAAYGLESMPELAILPGGTMNIVARSLGASPDPVVMLDRLLSGEARGRSCRCLKIGEDQIGFLFGNGIISRFLEVLYDEGETTTARAAWLLARGSLSAMVGGALARRLMQPFDGTVVVDGQGWSQDRWTAVAAGTVEQMGLGFRVFPLAVSHPDRAHMLGIGSGIVDLARELPRLYRGAGLRRPGNVEVAGVRMVLSSAEPIGCMIDGDFHRFGTELVVELGPDLRLQV